MPDYFDFIYTQTHINMHTYIKRDNSDKIEEIHKYDLPNI